MRCHRIARPLVAFLVVAPLGFYVGITDAYLAHHLYSANMAVAVVQVSDEEELGRLDAATLDAFNVPLPPEHRLFRQYFEKTRQPQTFLVVFDPRWWYRERGLELQMIPCSATC